MNSRSFAASNALHARALERIPLATQTFSKSALSFVKGASPLFLDHGKGCRVWDADGNSYIDYVMGLLPVILGYCDPDVDAAIRAQLEKGITFSLATELEIDLADRLRNCIPCAEMARFGKNGSDATTAAIRLARAVTGRDRVAACGYHGWHDWYIGSTTRNLGVPEAVRQLTSPFPYNDADALETLLVADPGGFAAVILEPTAFEPPAAGFLERVRALTERYGAVLIFDEIITGFRAHLGGAQELYGVTPDLACFGKALGNGMPISAVVGRRDHMRLMEEIFFSATFGGETLSLAAAITTIDKLEATDAIPRMHEFGAKLKHELEGVFARHGLDAVFRTVGPDWWPRIALRPDCSVESTLAISLMRQETVAQGILICASCNLSLAHVDDDVLGETLKAFDSAMAAVAAALDSADPGEFLRGEPIQPIFSVRT